MSACVINYTHNVLIRTKCIMFCQKVWSIAYDLYCDTSKCFTKFNIIFSKILPRPPPLTAADKMKVSWHFKLCVEYLSIVCVIFVTLFWKTDHLVRTTILHYFTSNEDVAVYL